MITTANSQPLAATHPSQFATLSALTRDLTTASTAASIAQHRSQCAHSSRVMDLNLDYFETVPDFLDQLRRHQLTDNLNLAERLCVRSQEYMDTLQVVYSRLLLGMRNVADEDGLLIELLRDVAVIIQAIQEFSNLFEELCTSEHRQKTVPRPSCSTLSIGRPGRLKYFVERSTIESMILLGYSYEVMAHDCWVYLREVLDDIAKILY